MRQLLNKHRYVSLIIMILMGTYSQAINPISEWQKPFPSHQLVTRSTPIDTPSSQDNPQNLTDPTPTPALSPPSKPDYEHIVLYSLQATIAAFHFEPATFSEDQIKLKQYFDDNALNQISQALLPGSGYGLLDKCFLKQTPCNAITYQPVIIEKQSPHFFQVRLPMVLSTHEKVDVVLSITYQSHTGFRVTNFETKRPNPSKTEEY